MKKPLSSSLLLIVVPFLSACMSACSGTHNYLLELEVDDGFRHSWNFEAKTDVEANQIAVNYINNEVSKNKERYAKVHIEYYLYSVKRNSKKLIPFTGYPDYFLTNKMEWEKAQYPKAYAGTYWGMSPNEVLAITHFKQYIKQGNILKGNETIGNENFIVKLHFDAKRGLYDVLFLAPFKESSFIDSYIKNNVNSFKDVIKKVYGSPDPEFCFEYPSVSSFISHSDYVVYRWVYLMSPQPTKLIDIGIHKNENNPNQYRMFAEIYLDLSDFKSDESSVLF